MRVLKTLVRSCKLSWENPVQFRWSRPWLEMLSYWSLLLGCIPCDQSESGFFNRKLDQIADQLEHKIRKRICFHTEVPGSRLPWDFWSAVHVIKQSRMRSINRLIKWNEQSKTSLRYQSERSASGGGSRLWNEKSNFQLKNLDSDWSKGMQPWSLLTQSIGGIKELFSKRVGEVL